MNIQQAAELAKARTTDKRWVAAIDKAVAGAQAWCVTELQHCVAITTESEKTYFANDKHCQCESFFHGKPCKHRALYRLLQIAETAKLETPESGVSTRADVIADIKARWPIAFPGVNLADELMRRFKRNSLEMLSIDFLTAIRAAI